MFSILRYMSSCNVYMLLQYDFGSLQLGTGRPDLLSRVVWLPKPEDAYSVSPSIKKLCPAVLFAPTSSQSARTCPSP